MSACSIPLRYVHEFCILTCLTIVWMKDPLGMLEDSPGRRILLRSVLVMILIYHKVLMVYGPLGGGSLLEISWWCIAHWGTFLYWGIIIFFFLVTHWGLMLLHPRGGFINSVGEILSCNSRGGCILCLGPMGKSFYDTKIWLGISLMILTHRGVFTMIFDPLSDFFFFDPQGLFLIPLIH